MEPQTSEGRQTSKLSRKLPSSKPQDNQVSGVRDETAPKTSCGDGGYPHLRVRDSFVNEYTQNAGERGENHPCSDSYRAIFRSNAFCGLCREKKILITNLKICVNCYCELVKNI